MGLAILGLKNVKGNIADIMKNGNMTLNKPGTPKKKKRKLKKLEMFCRWCFKPSPTCCFRHSEDHVLKFLSGGSVMGGKIPDKLTVFGCFTCDQKHSTKPDRMDSTRKKNLHSLSWAKGILRTWKPDLDITGLNLKDLVEIIKRDLL